MSEETPTVPDDPADELTRILDERFQHFVLYAVDRDGDPPGITWTTSEKQPFWVTLGLLDEARVVTVALRDRSLGMSVHNAAERAEREAAPDA